MKVAIVHEMLIKLWGAEKVVESLLKLFPEADLFTLIYDEKKVWTVFPKNKIKWVPKITSFIYKIFKNQRFCLPFMPLAVESFDLSEYDVVICSSSWFAHWLITKPETKFITYYHSPARYLWDWTNEYKKDIWFSKWIKWFLINSLMKKLRIWDIMASNRPDIVLANSWNSASRIFKYYRREAKVIYPPVEVNRFRFIKKWDYYIIISALVEFKKIEIAIEAFNNMPDKKLKIIWIGSFEKTLKEKVKFDNIEFLWAKYSEDLVKLVWESKWYVFPWEEDFWITPVEAMSAWKPVFAYNAWWLKETNIPWITWEFFNNKTWLDFVSEFLKFDEKINQNFYEANIIREKSLKFSEEEFHKNILKLIQK